MTTKRRVAVAMVNHMEINRSRVLFLGQKLLHQNGFHLVRNLIMALNQVMQFINRMG